MKHLLLILILFLSSCAATKPIRKPIGMGLLNAGGTILDVTTVPRDKLDASEMPVPVKIPLYIPTVAISLVGMGVGIPLFVGGFVVYPESMD